MGKNGDRIDPPAHPTLILGIQGFIRNFFLRKEGWAIEQYTSNLPVSARKPRPSGRG
ncbi:MAG: hypothetical protein ACTSUE_01850 [Promethearchaeota archaeon]